MRKTKFSAKSSGGIKSVLLGILVIWCAFLLLSLIFSVILFSCDDPTRSTSLVSLGVFVLSGAVGTIINIKLISADKSTSLLSSLLTAIIYLSASAVLSRGISIGAIISALCFMGASLLVGIPKKKKSKKHSHRV